MKAINVLAAFAFLLAAECTVAQTAAPPLQQFVIEREIKGAGQMTPAQRITPVTAVIGPTAATPRR